MIKKLFSMILCFALLVGCSGVSKPKGMLDETFEMAKSSIEVLDKYLDDKISKEEAKSLIDKYCDEILEISLDHSDNLPQEERDDDPNIRLAVNFCAHNEFEQDPLANKEDTLLMRNAIARLLGIKERK